MKALIAISALCAMVFAGAAAFAGQVDVTVVNQSSVDVMVERAAGPHGWMPEGLVLPANGGSATYGVALAPGEAATALLEARDGGSWQLAAGMGADGAGSCAVARKSGDGGAGAPMVDLDKDGDKTLCTVTLPWPEAGRDPSFRKIP